MRLVILLIFLSIHLEPLQAQSSSTQTLSTSFPVIEINISAFKHNIILLKQFLYENAADKSKVPKVCAVFKSDAYGLGIKYLAKTAVENGVDAFCIVENKEAETLRNIIGYEFPIIRIAPVTKQDLLDAFDKNLNLEEMVGSTSHAKMISHLWELDKNHLQHPINIHLNIDTGMSRMGFQDIGEARKVKEIKHLKIVGVMSHLTNAYAKKNALISSLKQSERFDKLVSELNLSKNTINHIANSGGTFLSPKLHKNMVRVGAHLYGYPFKSKHEKNRLDFINVVSSFKTKVVFIQRNIPPKTPVGYNGVFITPPNTKSTIATIRLGYINGIPHNTKGIDVLIHGHRCPIIGQIGMNLSMVDVSHIDEKANLVHIGDDVIIIGKQGDQEISLSELANKTQLPPVALLLQLAQTTPKRVKK